MFEAVARKKANWLFAASRSAEGAFVKRRPQEDLITSAVFGSIRLLPVQDRHAALRLVLGPGYPWDCEGKWDQEIEIELWKQLDLNGVEGRKFSEPDVLLSCADQMIIVEVKWHASLSDQQIELQLEASRQNDYNVAGVIVLGEVGESDTIETAPRTWRTWRDVSGDLQRNFRKDTPFADWVQMLEAFLQQTDMGQIFNGLPEICDPGSVGFLIPDAWFDSAISPVGNICFQFGKEDEY
jgi:hypothetical protein